MELPKSTAYGRIIAKDKLYEHGGANDDLQKTVARQIGRVRWANIIAARTMNLAQDLPTGQSDEGITEIELIEIELRVPFTELDRRILPLIVKAVPYSLLFKLIRGDNVDYALIYGGKVYQNNVPPRIIGNGINTVWDNIVRQIAGFPLNDTPLNDIIDDTERHNKLTKQIESLERKARSERQPRRKLEYAEEVKKLKELLTNG